MADLVLHPTTRKQFETFVAAPAQAVMFVGPTGSGKRTLAIQAAESILNIPSLADYPYALTITPVDDKAIGIESARQLEQFLSLKVPGKQAHDRLIIIEDAHLLTIEAQNALLKTLEEPPRGTLIILTVSHQQALLPTIRSRVQAITVTRPEKAALEAAFQDFDAAALKQAYAVSGGLPGLMHALLNETEHPLTQATEQARTLLRETAYERLLHVDELAKQKSLATDTAFILQQMAHVSLQTATGKATQRWQNILQASYAAAESLSNSAQPKLVLTNLMLSL